MERRLVMLILLSALHNNSISSLSHPSNGLEECRKNNSHLALEVLPGGGWDNLRNLDMGRVMNFSYSQCQSTEDGVYLIPDEVFVIPQKMTGVETSSEIFEHWLNHSSSTSQSINADTSFLPELNAKFSTESQRTKTYQVRDGSVTSRVQIRNNIYRVKTYPDFTLDSRFIQQVKEIAEALLNNNTRHATFLSEMMVVDYGTHVITSVDAGAILEGEDYINFSYYFSSEKSDIARSAGLNLFKVIKFDMDTKEKEETSESRSYTTNLTHSITQTHGGTLFYPGIGLKTWQESTLNNLVAIDRTGVPLHFVLNSATLPDIPETTIEKVSQSLRQAIQLYYNVNTWPGCVDMRSSNFNFQANLDDNSCVGPATNLTFGGIYQTCTPLSQYSQTICSVQQQRNPDTGDFTCRETYSPILLDSVHVREDYSQTECYVDCATFCLWDCCDTYCSVHYYQKVARVDTYWCATNQSIKPYSGYLFGGLYSQNYPNPLTRSMGCPAHFSALKFLSNGLMVCLSNDYEQATPFSVPFGGFFSCRVGNPLVQSEYRCPPGFSQHLATISEGCQILYCVKSGVFTGGPLPHIRLPPYIHPEVIRQPDNYTPVMVTEGDEVWLRKGQSNSWQRAKPGEVGRYVRQLHASRSEGGVIGGGFLVVFSVLLAIGIGFMAKRCIRGSVHRHREDYGAFRAQPEPGV